MNQNTSVYIDVPNAYSLHRIIAKEMGLIENIFEKSIRNISLQQNKVYDKELLIKSIRKNINSAHIEKCYSFFIKPFTHDQMMNCWNNKIINKEIIDGLYKTSKILKDYGCELCVFLRKVIKVSKNVRERIWWIFAFRIA